VKNPLRWQPRSLQQLILFSFLLVVAPLCVLIFQSTQSLTHQSENLRNYAQQALDTTARAQQMNQMAEDLLRASRQFQIVQQKNIKERLQLLAEAYRIELSIQSFWLDDDSRIQALHDQLDRVLSNPKEREPAQELYDSTLELEQSLRQRLQHRLTLLNTESEKTREQVWLMTIGLISLSGLLILLMLGTISRPIKDLSARIRSLGKGERKTFEPRRGPRELITLHEELNWLNEQLEALEQEKQRFLRHMSHELKTPLTSLREGTDLLAEGVTGPLNRDQLEVVELLQQQSLALQKLIEQLLDYNHLTQQVNLQIEPVTITSLIDEALSAVQLQLQQKAITSTQPETPFEWPTDRHMLMRILSNLISNATLYGSPNGRLQIQHQINDDQLLLDISNEGPTIPEAEVPRLFEPFYQGKNRRSGPVKGSGIGLSIAHDAAQALNGHLQLHENRDNIVTFRLSLPRPE